MSESSGSSVIPIKWKGKCRPKSCAPVMFYILEKTKTNKRCIILKDLLGYHTNFKITQQIVAHTARPKVRTVGRNVDRPISDGININMERWHSSLFKFYLNPLTVACPKLSGKQTDGYDNTKLGRYVCALVTYITDW
jgi:hypothetical protein